MNDIILPLPMFIAIFFLAILTSFVLGWEQSVARWRANDKKLRSALSNLEAAVSDLNDRLAEEPLKAAADHGKVMVVNQVESVIRRIREEME